MPVAPAVLVVPAAPLSVLEAPLRLIGVEALLPMLVGADALFMLTGAEALAAPTAIPEAVEPDDPEPELSAGRGPHAASSKIAMMVHAIRFIPFSSVYSRSKFLYG